MSWEKSWNFALRREKKMHISGHGGSVQVGVKQKTNSFGNLFALSL